MNSHCQASTPTTGPADMQQLDQLHHVSATWWHTSSSDAGTSILPWLLAAPARIFSLAVSPAQPAACGSALLQTGWAGLN